MIDLITRLRDKGIEVDTTRLSTTLVAEGLIVTAPTLDEALMLFLEKALEELRSLRQWKQNTMPLVTDWSDTQ